MNLRKFFTHSFFLLVLTATPLVQGQAPKTAGKVRQNCSAVTETTCTIAHALGRGVNLGNMLDPPREGDWGVRVEPVFITKATEVFTTVRLPVRWSNHAARTVDATLDEVFATRVDGIIDDLLSRGAYVIVNMHHYNQLSGFPVGQNEFLVDPSIVEKRFLNMWSQIAKRYRNKSPKLIFELLNEPTGPLEGEPWNKLSSDALREVRKTNPTRVVMIGPSGNRIPSLNILKLPADKNLIVAFHNYDPFNFTHQGIEWMPQFPKGPTCCNAGQRKLITDALDVPKIWNQKNGYPMHFGEFGSNDIAEMASREAYTRFIRDETEARGFGWTYWEFASVFGVYSPKTNNWVEPIRRALLD